MGKEYKKQHIVPQAYLKRFGVKNQNNKGYHTNVLSKIGNNSEWYTCAIDKVACKNNYYDDPSKEDEKYWEKHFANNLEPMYGTPLDNIIAKITLGNKEIVIDEDDKHKLSEMICFQTMRAPAFLDHSYKNGEKIQRETIDNIIFHNHEILSEAQMELLERLRKKNLFKNATLEHITSPKNIAKYAEVLSSRLWTINYNNSRAPFFTSDTPVVMYNFSTRSLLYRDNGIGRQETMILYPLTPKIMIQIYPGFFNLAGIRDCERVILSDSDMRYVNGVNEMQWKSAIRQVFCIPK